MPKLIPVVPAKERRKLHFGDKGNDVKAYGRLVARTLRARGITPINVKNGIFGDGLLKDTLRLQASEGLVRSGIVTTATWQAVDPQMRAYERLLLKLPQKPPATNRSKIAHQLEVMYALGMDYYAQDRPAATNLPAWKRKDDCSGSYLLARAVALEIAFNGYGNTGWIWENYPSVSWEDVEPGDAALYGHDGKTTHVQGVTDVSNRANPMSIGFGSAPGNKYPVHTRDDFLGYRRTA